MSVSGSVTSGLSAAMIGSFHFVISSWKMRGDAGRRELQLVDVGQVVRHGDRCDHGRDVDELAALELRLVLVLHDAVSAGEVDDLLLQVAATLA